MCDLKRWPKKKIPAHIDFHYLVEFHRKHPASSGFFSFRYCIAQGSVVNCKGIYQKDTHVQHSLFAKLGILAIFLLR